MKEERDRPGLGRVIYSVDEPKGEASQSKERVGETDAKTDAEVAIADQESFPASDPPGFAGGSKPDRD